MAASIAAAESVCQRQEITMGRITMNMLASAAWAGAFAILMAGSVRAGEQPTEQQILDALRPSMSRSISDSPVDQARAAEAQRAIEILRHAQKTRSLTTTQREQVAAVAKDRPKIDLEIYFDYNSAAITPKAVPGLNSLGRVLSSADLDGSVFMIAGHTDAKGGETYNLGLSERRAKSVRNYLVENFKLPAQALNAVGYGKEQLKDAQHPFAPENRRVQIVNMAAKSTADAK
jgi:outer membrane protein OmpA-like peptidoglycan-associated protein